MAKTAGGVRNSKWKGDIYTVDGVRKEYHELSDERKMIVRSMSKDVAKEMWRNLSGKSVTLEADGSMINVQFTKSGIDHVARDAMIVLSGKYMSRNSMVHINKVLAKSEYVPTSHSVYSRSLKDALPLNSQQINMRFALRYLQVFVPLRLKTCRLYDKQDLSPALIVQFVGRPTEPQTSLVSARRQD